MGETFDCTLEKVVETEAPDLPGTFLESGDWLWLKEDDDGELLEDCDKDAFGFKMLDTSSGSNPRVSNDLASSPCNSFGSRPNNLGSGALEDADGEDIVLVGFGEKFLSLG